MVDRDQDEGDEQNPSHDPKSDLGSTVERKDDPTKGDCHCEAGTARGENRNADPVLSSKFLSEWNIHRIDVR